MPDNGMQQELIDGKVVEMPPPGVGHGRSAIRFARLLDEYVEEHDLGFVFCNDSGIILRRNPDCVRGPDVAFIARERAPEGLPEGYTEIVPDLIVEVLSPGDSARRVRAKTAEWLAAGARLVITVDRRNRTVIRETTDSRTVLHADDELTCEPVLPGFRVRVSRLFP